MSSRNTKVLTRAWIAFCAIMLVGTIFVWRLQPKAKIVPTVETTVPILPAKYPEPLPFNRGVGETRLSLAELDARAVSSRVCLAMGGIVDPVAAAKRVSDYWPTIQAAARERNIPAEQLAGVIMLESQGRSWVMSGADAAGIGQFIPRTARRYGLKMAVRTVKIEVKGAAPRMRYYTATGTKALLNKRNRLLKQLAKKPTVKLQRELKVTESAIRRLDERFDTKKAIRASARYLAALYADFGDWDWATAAYHMGSPTAQRLLRRYATGYLTWERSAKATLAKHDITWTRFLFDVTPARHPATFKTLYGLEDQSHDYALRVRASWQVVALWRNDCREFYRLLKIYNHRYNGRLRRWQLADELRWYPRRDPHLWKWETPGDLATAFDRGELVSVPQTPAAKQAMGIVLGKVGMEDDTSVRHLYALTRPETAGGMYLLAAFYRDWSRNPKARLQINSLVRCNEYQRKFVRKGWSPSVYSGHCAGLSFDINPPTKAVELECLKSTLRHFRYLGYWVWFKEGDHYHVTISPLGRRVLLRVWQAAGDISPPRPPKAP